MDANIASIVVSIITAAVGPVTILMAQYFFKRKDKNLDAIRVELEKKRDAAMKKALEPHGQQIAKLQEQMNATLERFVEQSQQNVLMLEAQIQEAREATILGMRSEMKRLRDVYVERNYADVGDKALWTELYQQYKAMGGNHFAEYVNEWRDQVKNLPTKKEKR